MGGRLLRQGTADVENANVARLELRRQLQLPLPALHPTPTSWKEGLRVPLSKELLKNTLLLLSFFSSSPLQRRRRSWSPLRRAILLHTTPSASCHSGSSVHTPGHKLPRRAQRQVRRDHDCLHCPGVQGRAQKGETQDAGTAYAKHRGERAERHWANTRAETPQGRRLQ